MTTVFDKPVELLIDDLAHLCGDMDNLICLLANSPSIDSMQRAHLEINRTRLTDFADDITRALGEEE